MLMIHPGIPLFIHLLRSSAGDDELAGQVDVHHAAEFFYTRGKGILMDTDTRVIKHYVQPAAAAKNLLHGRVHVFFPGYIARYAVCLSAKGFD